MYRFKGNLDTALGSSTFTFENIPAGAYKIQVRYDTFGYAKFKGDI